MTATIPYIEQRFNEFNQQCFDGRLAPLPIKLSNARTFLGKCVFRKRRRWDGRIEKYDFRLFINARADLPQDLLDDTILHEMIHYYIESSGIKDTSTHGKFFRTIMNDINERFGRHISISHKSTPEEHALLQDNRRRWHVVAVMSLNDGRHCIKVLPRIQQRIRDFYTLALRSRDITTCTIYLTDNPFFNRFPTSSSLRMQILSEEEININMEGAQELKVHI